MLVKKGKVHGLKPVLNDMTMIIVEPDLCHNPCKVTFPTGKLLIEN